MSKLQGYFKRRPFRRALANWLERHQHPFNRGIHYIGIPMTTVGIALLFWYWPDWIWGVAVFLAGYVLQWIGHLVEGNDLGEWAGVKRFLGWPYVAIAPRYEKKDASPPSPT